MKANDANKNGVFFGADFAKTKHVGGWPIPYGKVTFSQDGISYRPYMWLMRGGLVNKFIYKFVEKKTVFYRDIISVTRETGWLTYRLKVVTNEVNGSYYLFLPKSQESSLTLLSRFIQRCREVGFEIASTEELSGEIRAAYEVTKKDYRKSALIIMILGFLIAVFYNLWIAYIVLFTSYFAACASESKALRLVNFSLIVLCLLMLYPYMS